MQISTAGVVIRDYKHEDNRILTLLTETHGVITAFANRASRPNSGMTGSTELLCYSDFVLFRSRGKYFVNNADSIRTFFKIRSNFEALALASYFAQLTEQLAPVEEAATPFLQLILGCLHYLENEERPVGQLKAIFELRLFTLAGYMPDLVGCRVCHCFDADKIFFTPSGELVCGDCIGQTDPTGLIQLPTGVLAAMRHIIYADPKKIFSFTLSEEGFAFLATVSERYTLYQLERTLPTLEFYRGLVENPVK